MSCPWMYRVMFLTTSSINFILLAGFFYLPVVILIYQYSQAMVNKLLQNSQHEINLLKFHIMTDKEVKNYYMYYTMLIGFSGGVLGSVGGIFLAFGFYNWGIALSPITLDSFLSLFPFSNFWPILFYSILMAMLMRFTTKKAYLQYANSKVKEPLTFGSHKRNSYQEVSHSKFNLWVDLIVLSLTITGFLISQFGQLYKDYAIFVIFAQYIFEILLFIAPISIIRLCFRYRKSFLKILSNINFIKPKVSTSSSKSKIKWKVLHWRMQRDVPNIRNNLEIFVISSIYIIAFFSLHTSFQYSQDVYRTLVDGNGTLVQYDLERPLSISNNSDNIHHFADSLEEYGINDVITVYNTQENRAKFINSSYDIEIQNIPVDDFSTYYKFGTLNYTDLARHVVLRDDWFIGGTAQEIFTKLEQDNNILVPAYLLNYLDLNDTISFVIHQDNGGSINETGTVIGGYSIFPSQKGLDQGLNRINTEFYMSMNLLRDAPIRSLYCFFYTENGGLTNFQFTSAINLAFQDIPGCSSYSTTDESYVYDEFDLLFLRFFNFEAIAFIIFGIWGQIIFNNINNQETSVTLASLRSRGYEKRDIIWILRVETAVMGILGLVFSLLLFFLLPVFLFGLNQQRSSGSHGDFFIYTKYNWLASGLTIGLGGIAFMVINFLTKYRQLQETNVKSTLDRILRRQS
ncbi:MAG: hypothetical protein E4G98_07000 [Promethearchaeota archaeon]|nr:MAG: hypothetical protein E4G98_07000 [Candidatus Lokiarchaeota archaeon]